MIRCGHCGRFMAKTDDVISHRGCECDRVSIMSCGPASKTLSDCTHGDPICVRCHESVSVFGLKRVCQCERGERR